MFFSNFHTLRMVFRRIPQGSSVSLTNVYTCAVELLSLLSICHSISQGSEKLGGHLYHARLFIFFFFFFFCLCAWLPHRLYH